MPRNIYVLNDQTINQIAAGEVIENAASVIKELVENAIDAAATSISIETKAVGRGWIKVTDNGMGMHPDDLLLSIERHATSKLLNTDELNSLKTLGFRGEALPSIASVSKMLLHSSHDENGGLSLYLEGGKIHRVIPLPRRRGTTIEVKSLFYNVPVRKQFQKNMSADLGNIHKMLNKFALCYPDLEFNWSNDGKMQFAFLGCCNRDERIKAIMGQEFMNSSLPLEYHEGSMALSGRVSLPFFTRPNRVGQFLFINQRAVISPWFSQKIQEAYATRLSNQRFPLFILYFNLSPSLVDVNVHPQKREVRLREEENLARFIHAAIATVLEQSNLSPEPFKISIPQLKEENLFFSEPSTEYLVQKRYDHSLFSHMHFSVIAKVKHFIFIEDVEGISLIHGQRALERIVFEELEKKGNKDIQSLLLPLTITVGKEEQLLLESHLEKVNEMGISIRHFGGNAYLIDAIPAILEPSEIEDLILGYLEEEKIPLKVGAYLKRSIFSLEEWTAIIKKLRACKNPDVSPCGQSIQYLLNEKSLEKFCL
jgi:DNA mismatch repair protein MutL